jgi:ZIP family zinc transporter
VTLFPGISILALAALIGGLLAVWRDPGHRWMPGVRTFATMAAAGVALLHLLPESIADVGYKALIAAAAGLFTPIALERFSPSRDAHGHAHAQPATLAMGYMAVLAHQMGEGAAVASLARVGELSAPVVLAIAAHTVPLSMVVALRVLEARGEQAAGAWRFVALAVAGLSAATVAGGAAGDLLGQGAIEVLKPWLIAAVSGLLLHMVLHDETPEEARSTRGRLIDAGAGLVGLSLSLLGLEQEPWVHALPWPVRALGLAVLAGGVVARCLLMGRADHRQAGAAE